MFEHTYTYYQERFPTEFFNSSQYLSCIWTLSIHNLPLRMPRRMNATENEIMNAPNKFWIKLIPAPEFGVLLLLVESASGGSGRGAVASRQANFKMATSMFNLTNRLKKGVTLINGLDSSRFPLLLSRIIGKLNVKGGKIFSDEEQEKLCSAFNVELNDLQSVLDTSVFILEQAAYHTAKAATLTQQLKNIQLLDDKVEMFVTVWSTHGKAVIEELKQRSVTSKQLDSVKWKLNLQMAQSSTSKMKVPSAVVELGLKGNKDNSENICLEFTHEELYSFYNQLEKIKSQLDGLR